MQGKLEAIREATPEIRGILRELAKEIFNEEHE